MMGVFGIFLAVLFIISAIGVWWYHRRPAGVPPGPIGFPLLGSAPFMTPQTAQATIDKWIRKFGPIFGFYRGTKLVVVVSDYDLMQEAFQKRGDVFGGKAVCGYRKGTTAKYGLLDAEGARWKEQRRFALSTLRDFGFGRSILQPKISREIQALLAWIGDTNEEPFDPKPRMANALNNVISELVFGHPFEANSELKRCIEEISYRNAASGINALSIACVYPWLVDLVGVFSPDMRRVSSGAKDVADFVQAEIDAARKTFSAHSSQLPQSFVHAFDKATVEHQLAFGGDAQLRAVVRDLFVGGTDTNTVTMCWSLFYMASHPEIQEKVHREITEAFGYNDPPGYSEKTGLPFTAATLLEVQRLATVPHVSIIHRATTKGQLAGYTIPEDSWILLSVWSVHRNPKYFPQPFEFRPERFLDKDGRVATDLPVISFSTGKRSCLGESLARMELFMFFTALMQQFQFSFASKEDAMVEPVIGIVRSPGKFFLRAKKRQQP